MKGKNMFRTLLSIVLVVSIASVSLAQTAAPKTDEKAPAAKPAPKAPTKKPAYDPVAEKAKFFKIAGKDTEVDAKEFAAALAKVTDKAEGFVRKTDRWSSLLRYDKNNNKKIDWFEADAYRKQARTGRRYSGRRGREITDPATIKKFDKDGDGKLNDGERSAARSARFEEMRKEFLKENDADGDGKLSDEERRAGFRKRMESMRRRWTERRYDKDRDGKLNDEEKAAMEKGEAARAAERKKRTEEYIKKYDKNGDGKVDDKERPQRRSFRGRRRRGGGDSGGATE